MKIMCSKKIWNNSSIENRKKLLKAMGYGSMSWAKIRFEDLGGDKRRIKLDKL